MSATQASEAPVVPVQLTTIAPVRVFNVHGDFFDTEVDVDAPLRPLQLAIEDYFLVKAEVQLLLHNRQQIDPALSLRQNGCLMLKGDPYVKLVFSVKRGTLLNLIFHVRGGQRVRGGFSFPLACAEMSTVWEVKQLIAHALLLRQRRLDAADATAPTTSATVNNEDGALNPHRVRIMWRYMALNDKATLHYYRVPTNAEMHVRLHRGPVPAYHTPTTTAAAPSSAVAAAQATERNNTGVRADLAHIPPAHFNDAVRVGVPRSIIAAPAEAADAVMPLDVWQQQQRRQAQQEQPPHQDAHTTMMPSSFSSAATLSTRPVVCDVRHYAQQPQPLPNDPVVDSRTGHAVLPLTSQSHVSASPTTHGPISELQLLSESTNTAMVEISTLRRQTQWVTTELEVLKQQYLAQQTQLQTSTALRRELEYRSVQRIEELESSMQHFQHYLERALRLLANSQPSH